MKKGIDVSLWDPALDWTKYSWDFVFIKVSEGKVIDPKFDVHWVHAKGHTKRSGYHFFRAYVDPHEAADRFIEYLDGDMGELPPVLDLESIDNVDAKTSVSRALTWLIEVEKKTNVTPIVYSSPSFITSREDQGGLALWKYPDFARYPLWLAVYPYDKLYAGYTEASRTARLHEILIGERALPMQPIPEPFKVMRYIQWTSRGSPFDVPGYYTGTGHKKAVDFNFQLEEESDEGEPMPETIKEGTVSAAKLQGSFVLNYRSSAGVQTNPSNDIGDLFSGDKVYGKIVSAVWIEFMRIIRKNGNIEMVHGFASTQYMDVRDVPVEPPTPGQPTVTGATIRFSDGSAQEMIPAP